MLRKIIVLMFMWTTLSASELNIPARSITASFYASKFQGRITASGEKFDSNKLTAASNLHVLGQELLVCHKDVCIEVKVNDRISKKYSSRIDLSKGAFKKLADPKEGLIEVQIKEL